MKARTHPTAATSKRAPVQKAAALVGAVFLLVGILGFIPGITTNYDDLAAAGHESRAELLGIFQVSVLHNVVHLLFGAAGLTLARTVDSARTYLVAGGAVYLALWIYGMVIDKTSAANFVPINTADDWLHFVLGVAMIGARDRARAAPSTGGLTQPPVPGPVRQRTGPLASRPRHDTTSWNRPAHACIRAGRRP